MSQSDERYEPPALTEIGSFTELTLGVPSSNWPKDILGWWAPL